MEIETRTTPVIPAPSVTPVIPGVSEITPIPRYDNVDKSIRTVTESFPDLPAYRYSKYVAPGTVKYVDYGYYDEDEEEWIVLKTVPIYSLMERSHREKIHKERSRHFVGKEIININETD